MMLVVFLVSAVTWRRLGWLYRHYREGSSKDRHSH